MGNKTADEVQDEFIGYVVDMIQYWYLEYVRTGGQDPVRALSGLAHSILATLDGRANLVGFIVAPDPHPADTDGYPMAPIAECDIAGDLCERLYQSPKWDRENQRWRWEQ